MYLLEEWLVIFLNDGEAVINGEWFAVAVIDPVRPAVILADADKAPPSKKDKHIQHIYLSVKISLNAKRTDKAIKYMSIINENLFNFNYQLGK